MQKTRADFMPWGGGECMTAWAITQPEFDICYARHGGNRESREAFNRAQRGRTKNCLRILRAIEAAGEHGLTAKEYSATSGRPLNAISGRFSDLKKDKLIIKTGERRNGSAVCVAV